MLAAAAAAAAVADSKECLPGLEVDMLEEENTALSVMVAAVDEKVLMVAAVAAKVLVAAAVVVADSKLDGSKHLPKNLKCLPKNLKHRMFADSAPSALLGSGESEEK